MADYTELVTIADFKVDNRWIGISQILPTINGQTPDNDLTRVKMTFRLGATTFTLDSDEGASEITIDDANTWECTIPAQEVFLPRAGKWEFELDFWQETHTSPLTLYKGTLVVHDDLS